MYLEEICKNVDFQLRNIAYYEVKEERDYSGIISPYSRIYFITKGNGRLHLFNSDILLEKGFMYLIPSYTSCSYLFREGFQHYYIHFSNQLDNGLNLYDLFTTRNKAKFDDFEISLIKRLLSLHPDIALPSNEPAIYQNKPWLNKKPKYSSISQLLETKGILGQLLSVFLLGQKVAHDKDLTRNMSMTPILKYIQSNLHKEISVSELAEMAFYNKDHFTRVFKNATGYPPGEFVLKKRIEKAQFLLLTTNLSQVQICDKAGFSNISYFSRIFKKHTGFTPGAYRRNTN